MSRVPALESCRYTILLPSAGPRRVKRKVRVRVPATVESLPRAAALDVGSNTIRLLVASPKGGDLVPICEESCFVRLGEGVSRHGKLTAERRQMAIEAIGELARAARKCGATELRAVATSAVRDASNGQDFARTVEKRTGVKLEILTGEDEARLTFLGTTMLLNLTEGALVADIGGGSSEIIGAADEGMLWAESFDLGSGRLTEHFVTHDPPIEAERLAVRNHVLGLLSRLPQPAAHLMVFTGGTATNVAALATGERGITVPVGPDQIERVEALAYSMPAAELSAKHGVRPERAAVFPAGTTIVQTIAEWSNAPEILVTRHGIREGVILDSLSRTGLRGPS